MKQLAEVLRDAAFQVAAYVAYQIERGQRAL